MGVSVHGAARWLAPGLLVLLGVACSDHDKASTDAAFHSTSANRCATPRSGLDPGTGKPYPDVQGTVDDERTWLREWTDALYLWYREVPASDAHAYPTPVDYFDVLKTPAVTASGKPKDRFHFWYPTAEWQALSQSGVQAGYGVQWVITSEYPPRSVVAAYNEPGSPAATAGVARGTRVLTVDGVDVAYGSDVNTLNAGLFPGAGQTHTLSVQDAGSTVARTVTLTAANVQGHPVQKVGPISGHSTVGYILFNDHLATAELALLQAIASLKSSGVTDLVVDMRYNGGGYVVVASELAYMIAGPTVTAGKAFERTVFNDKYTSTDPVTGEANTPMPFLDAAVGLSALQGQPLPHLDLARVVVLSGPGTCSASESVMNGLRGVDVQVVQVGETTCGKPYAFYPEDNCGTTYFSIQLQGVNQKGFGDYGDGFVPGGTGTAGLPGCLVADDFDHALGDPAEARLAAALQYLSSGTCPGAGPVASSALTATASVPAAIVPKSPWQQNRIYVR
jgi:carboxyl-terminal processing protease